MDLFVPLHQFEIRFSKILNHSYSIKDAIAPFSKLAKRINIENENTHNERIFLIFDDEYYHINISWDRIVIRTEGYSEGLSNNNSIIEEPFFNILSKIKEIKGFGEILNFLYYTFWINIKNDEIEKIKDDFITKYLNKGAISSFTPISDLGLIFESKKENIQSSISIGPYFGITDLIKRNIQIINPVLTNNIQKGGEMLEFKYYENNKKVTFNQYKDIHKQEQIIIDNLWKN